MTIMIIKAMYYSINIILLYIAIRIMGNLNWYPTFILSY